MGEKGERGPRGRTGATGTVGKKMLSSQQEETCNLDATMKYSYCCTATNFIQMQIIFFSNFPP